jgi:hypothetical protein
MELVGSWQRPRNVAADRKGSIHDDEAAKALGFAGGWVSARVHLNVLVPLLLEAFGRKWFERGMVSLDFRHATLDADEVRAILDVDASHAAVRLEQRDGTAIATGDACVGAWETTALGTRDLAARDDAAYRLITNVMPGDEFPTREIVLREPAARRMIGGVGHEWYLDGSPWGPPVASPSLMVNALGAACGAYLREHPIGGVFIDGGTEIRNVNGPVLLDTPYVCSGRVLARGASPRTEYFWYESGLDDEQGRRVAEMLLQWRCMPSPRSS